MKRLGLFMMIGFVSVAAWQRWTLVELRRAEMFIAAEQRPEAGHEKWSPGVGVDQMGSPYSNLSEAEFAKFAAGVQIFRDLSASQRTTQKAAAKQMESLYEPLSRLSPAQLSSIVETWTGGQPITDQLFQNEGRGLLLFMYQAAGVNPAATIEYLSGHRWPAEEANSLAGRALWYWFKQDSGTLWRWTIESGQADDFDGQGRLWADAITVVRDPSVENVRSFLSHGRNRDYRARSEIMLKLPTQESRMTFLRSMYEATGGVVEHVDDYISPLVQCLSFSQLAQLADSTPAFKEREPQEGESDSLRLEVARKSRDGTATQRWEWLTQRAEDRPTGKMFAELVNDWCENDYPDTAAWVRSLAPGPEREQAIKEVISYLEDNEGANLLSEWKAQ